MTDQDIILCRKAYYSVGIGSELSPHGTGANIELEVRLLGQIDPQTELVVNLTDVQVALDELHKLIDHKHFQFDVEGFSGDPKSPQDISQYCWDFLKPMLTYENAHLHELEIQFNENTRVLLKAN